MKSHTHLRISIIAVFILLLSACNLSQEGGNETDQNQVNTQAAQTASAMVTNTPPAVPPTVVITPVQATATLAVTPTNTATTPPTSTPTTTPSPTPATCNDKVKFISDVTVLDNTEFLAGQEFVKTWRLENAGTCTWTDQYSLVFVDGDQMSGKSPLPLSGSTNPGNTADVSITLKAPGTAGTFKGNWQLRNPAGVTFGTGTNANQSFFVQIRVVEGVSGLNLGAPTWSDPMDDSDYWYLLETANTKFAEGDGVLVMTSKQPGGGEEWGLANKAAMDDYYLQATFITGDACSGLDKYGLLGRAPDENKGYVFEFSCDGHYRLYTWDGENYHALQEWWGASPIKQGPNQTNVMGLWMQATKLQLFANGFKIAEFIDSTYDEGQFGLVIGSVNTENFTVNVDMVEYWELDQ